METLHFAFDGGRALPPFAPALVGVVASGNLEVLVEPAPGTGCRIDIDTSARGFGAIWEAVLRDFHDAPRPRRHRRLDPRHGRDAGRRQPAARPGDLGASRGATP